MTTLADAYDALAEAAATVALALRLEAATRPQNGPSGTTAPSFEELPFEDVSDEYLESQAEAVRAQPAGSAAVCPSHNIPYRKGRYGQYCPSLSDDPEWSNDKGYCRITPKSAAVWLRQHAA